MDMTRMVRVWGTITLAVVATGCSESARTERLRVGIAPYQDIAMIVNVEALDLEAKYGVDLELITMNWEDILPAVASLGRTVDVGFASLAEFLAKERNMNRGVDDPVVFFYPAYVFKGGAFISFDTTIAALDESTVRNGDSVRVFLGYRIGAQRSSIYEMMLFSLAGVAGVDYGQLTIVDTPLNDGILATEQGSLDIASAGLTQLTEARVRGGRALLTMEDMGFADITGFVAKRSTLEQRRADVEAMIHMWFASVDFVMSDLDRNSSHSLAYLDEVAATQYTLESYKAALSQEYFPRSVAEADSTIVREGGQYSYSRIAGDIAAYLVQVQGVERPAPMAFIEVR